MNLRMRKFVWWKTVFNSNLISSQLRDWDRYFQIILLSKDIMISRLEIKKMNMYKNYSTTLSTPFPQTSTCRLTVYSNHGNHKWKNGYSFYATCWSTMMIYYFLLINIFSLTFSWINWRKLKYGYKCKQ